ISAYPYITILISNLNSPTPSLRIKQWDLWLEVQMWSGFVDVSRMKRTILTDWAWDCYQEGRLNEFVENDLEALDDYKKLTTFVMVGHWCMCPRKSISEANYEKIVAQRMNGSVPIGASLTATENARSWLSPSGDFAFGFQRIRGKDNYVLSIWYDKIPDKTIIWYPQGNPMVSRGSKVELINGRGLVLSDPQGTDIWVSRPISNLAYAVMNDTDYEERRSDQFAKERNC
ncbi:G-type lectin S-receptor-like serine/threonine-protein kinase LECRK3, partial [Tanacetum coccineum]